MALLQRIDSESPVDLYELVEQERDPRIHVYVASTPYTRIVCAQPDAYSSKFQGNLQRGIHEILDSFPFKQQISDLADADVLYILRGGLNFDPRSPLEKAGLLVTSHFAMEQREQRDGKWEISEGSGKLFTEEDEPRRVSLFCGDIVATGTSLEYGLRKTLEAMGSWGHKLQSFYFFPIGGGMTEEVVEKVVQDKAFKEVIDKDFETHIVYLEGRFGIATADTHLRIKQPGTNLLAYHENAIVTPEFMVELLKEPTNSLEDCCIYDGGKRSFSPRKHFSDVIKYWKELRKLAQAGTTFHKAVNERIPFTEKNTVWNWHYLYPSWKNIPDSQVREVVRAGRTLLRENPDTIEHLVKVCDERIEFWEKKLRLHKE